MKLISSLALATAATGAQAWAAKHDQQDVRQPAGALKPAFQGTR